MFRGFRLIKTIQILGLGLTLLLVSQAAEASSVCDNVYSALRRSLTASPTLARPAQTKLDVNFYQDRAIQAEAKTFVYLQVLPSMVKTLRDEWPADVVNEMLLAAKQHIFNQLARRGLADQVYLIDFKSIRLGFSHEISEATYLQLLESLKQAQDSFQEEIAIRWGMLEDTLRGSAYSFGVGRAENFAAEMARRRLGQELPSHSALAAEEAQSIQNFRELHQLAHQFFELWKESPRRRHFIAEDGQGVDFDFIVFMKLSEPEGLKKYFEDLGPISEGLSIAEEFQMMARLGELLTEFMPPAQYPDALRPLSYGLDSERYRSAITIDLKKVGLRLYDEAFRNILALGSLSSASDADIRERIEELEISGVLDFISAQLNERTENLMEQLESEDMRPVAWWRTGDEVTFYFDQELPRTGFFKSQGYNSRLLPVMAQPRAERFDQREAVERIRMWGEAFTKHIEQTLPKNAAFELRVVEREVVNGRESVDFIVTVSKDLENLLREKKTQLESHLPHNLTDVEVRLIVQTWQAGDPLEGFGE